jgi:hypothetical protein
MVPAPARAAFGAPTFVRLLVRLADADASEPTQSLSDRLSQWLGWTDAIALSTALNGNPPTVASDARTLPDDEARLCARVRQSLANAIASDGDGGTAAAKRARPAQASAGDAGADTVPDYAVFRQRCLSLQQAMETDIGNLRGRLRLMLAARMPAMARLAAVDAVIERALSARERSLFAAVPALLGAHFERLRDAHRQTLADAEAGEDAAARAPGAWLDAFRNDMQSVLLAELEVRFQPVEGLLAALRTR